MRDLFVFVVFAFLFGTVFVSGAMLLFGVDMGIAISIIAGAVLGWGFGALIANTFYYEDDDNIGWDDDEFGG